MKAIICDVCQKVIEGGPYNEYAEANGEQWSISIRLDNTEDRCEECARKLFAKIARLAWDDLKNKRGAKVKREASK